MSQINTDKDECGWTPVRSKKMIKNLKDSERPPTPGMIIVSSSLRGSPTFSEQNPIITDTKSENIIDTKPENIIDTKPENIIEKSKNACENSGNKVKPIINQAVNFLDQFKEQMINKTNINNQNKDQWDVAFEFLKVQQTILMNSINVVSNELKYPYFLRGKSDEQRNSEINDRLFKIINDILIIIKEERQVKNEWIDTMTPGKITGMIIQSEDIQSKITLLTNISEITSRINDVCDILIEENKKTIKIVSASKKDTETKETTSNNKNKSPEKKDDSKIFTIDERIDHKKNLVAGQEVFFKSCLPTDEEVEKIKEIIKTNKNWSGYVHKIDISEDEIKINNYSFSKKQYINNVFFQKRLKTKFYQIFNPKNISFFFSKKNPSIINVNATFE